MDELKILMDKMELHVIKECEKVDNNDKIAFIAEYNNTLPRLKTISKLCNNSIFICCL